MLEPENWKSLAEALATVIAAVIVAVGSAIAIVASQRAKLRQIASDARAAADQTTNSHEEAEYPNLREELTATRSLVAEVRQDIGGLRAEIRQLHTDQSDDRKALREHLQQHSRQEGL